MKSSLLVLILTFLTLNAHAYVGGANDEYFYNWISVPSNAEVVCTPKEFKVQYYDGSLAIRSKNMKAHLSNTPANEITSLGIHEFYLGAKFKKMQDCENEKQLLIQKMKKIGKTSYRVTFTFSANEDTSALSRISEAPGLTDGEIFDLVTQRVATNPNYNKLYSPAEIRRQVSDTLSTCERKNGFCDDADVYERVISSI